MKVPKSCVKQSPLTLFACRKDCEAQVKGYAGAKYKKFSSAIEAEDFVNPQRDRASKTPGREESVSKIHEEIVIDSVPYHNSSRYHGPQSHQGLAALDVREQGSDKKPLASGSKSTLENPHQEERMPGVSGPHPEISNISSTQRSSRLDSSLNTSSVHSSRNMPGAFDSPSTSGMNVERSSVLSPLRLNISSHPPAGPSRNSTRSLYPSLEPLPPSIVALSSGRSSGNAPCPTSPIHVTEAPLPAFVPAKLSTASSSAALPVNNGYNLKLDKYIIYCDGACKNNGQTRPVAGIGVWWGNGNSRYTSLT